MIIVVFSYPSRVFDQYPTNLDGDLPAAMITALTFTTILESQIAIILTNSREWLGATKSHDSSNVG